MAESAFDILNGSLVGDEGGPVTEDLPDEEYDPDPIIQPGNPNDLRFVTEGDFNTQSESVEIPVKDVPADVAFELALLPYRPADPVVGDEGGPVTTDIPYEEYDPNPLIAPGNPNVLHFGTKGDFQIGDEGGPVTEDLPDEEYDPDPIIEPGNPNDLRFVTQGDFNTQSDSDDPSIDEVPADLAFEVSLLPFRPEVVGDEDIEGGHFTRRAPGFGSYEAKRAAGDNPLVRYSDYPHVSRDWTLDFGPVNGPVGFITVITTNPQVLFRGEKIIATDTATPPGTGTRIVSVTVGAKIQRPIGGNGILTQFFDDNALANGITFDTAKPWSRIQVTVSFVKPCTFDMTVFGKAVL